MFKFESSCLRSASLVSAALVILGSLVAGCGGHPSSGTTTLVSSIRVTADNSSINAGATTQLHAMSTSSAGQTSDVTSTVAWSSASPTVAAVSTSGMLTGMSAGNATITASLSGVSGAYSAAVGAPGVTGVSLTPKSAAVFTHGKQAYTVFATYANNTSGDASASATWSVAPASVATISGGMLTAVAPGNYTVTAAIGAQTMTATGTVVNAPVTSIAVTPGTASIAGGSTQKFTATETCSDGSTADVSASATWTSSNPALLTIDANGLATAIGTSGTVTVTGQYGAFSAKATVTLTSAATLTALVVTPTSSSIANGSAEPHAATATYSDGSQKDVTGSVTWSVVPGTTSSVGTAKDQRLQAKVVHGEAALDTVAPVVTVDQTGVDWAMSPGITTVQASMGGLQSQSVVIVTAATVKSLAITSSKTLFPAGSMQPVQLIGHFSDGTTQDLTLTANWVSSDPTVATIDSKGTLSGIKAGKVHLSASFGGLSTSSGDMTVLPTSLLYLQVKTYITVLPPGFEEQLQMIGTFSDGTVQDLTTLSSWSTANPNVVTVESSGVVHPVEGGVTEVTGTALGRTATISLQAGAGVVAAVSSHAATPSFALGTTDSFSNVATIDINVGTSLLQSQADATASSVWTSSDPTVFTINSQGVAKAGKVGSATVTASFLGLTQASVPVQVTGATLWRLVVSPNSTQIAALTGQQYKAIGFFSNATVQDVTDTVTWTTEDITVALITQLGQLYGVKPGKTHVVATFGGHTVRYPVTVTAATLETVTISPANTELPVGIQRQFALIGTFSDGTTQDISTQAVWSTNTPSIVSIQGQGIVFGPGQPGVGAVTAQYGLLSASTSVNITNVSLTSLSLAPANTKIRSGDEQPMTLTGTFSDGFSQVITLDDTYTSSMPGVAQILNSDATAYAVSTGTTQITANFQGVSTTTNSFRVVSGAMTSIAITPLNPSLAAGATQQFKATATYADGTTADVSSSTVWTSANPAVLDIDSNGFATALATTAAVSIQVTAQGIGASGTTTVNVTPATGNGPSLQTLTISPSTVSFASGSTQQFSLTGTYSDGSTQDLTPSAIWTSSAPSVATISSTGRALGLNTGTVQFSASFGGLTTTSGVSTVTPGKTVAALLVKPSSSSIAAGSAEQHSAYATYSDGTQADVTQNVTWSVVPVVASSAANTSGLTAQARAIHAFDASSTVATVNQAGVDTAVTPGMTTVQANLGSMQSQSVVIVTPATVTGINIFSAHQLIPAGTTQQIQLIGTFSDGSYQDLSLTANWQSSNTAIATIDQTGLMTGVSAGTVAFTASFGGLTASTQGFQVLPLGLVSTTLTALYPAPLTGTCQQLKLIGTYVDGSTHELSSLANWSSANSKLLTVDNTGMACAVPYDAATVTVTATQISATVFGETSVINMATVFDPVVAVNVYPQPAKFALGTRLPLEALTQVQNGVFLDLTVDASWISADPTVFTIDANGLAKSGKVGTTTVQATVLGVTGTSMPIEVTNATIKTLLIVAKTTGLTAPTQIAAGTGMVYQAIGFFSDGNSQDLSQDVVWDTTDNTIAAIGATGIVQGIKPGQVQVTASFGGQTISVPLTVTNATLLSAGLSPNNIELPIGTKRTFSFLGNFTDGSTQDLSYDAIFSTTTPSIIAYLGQGQAIGAGPGQGVVSAQRGYFTASTPVNVKLTYVTSIAMNPVNNILRLGSSQVVNAIGTFDDGLTMNLVDNAIFSSQNPQVASVQQTGRVLTTGLGSSTISASFEGSTATANVQVLSGTLTSLNVTPANPSLLLGATQQFSATGTYTDGTTGDVTAATTWVSGNPLLLSIDANGLAKALSLTGLSAHASNGLRAEAASSSPATVPVTGTSGGQSKTVNATILPAGSTAPTISSIAVTPANSPIAKGNTQQMTATATYSDGSTGDVSSSAMWASSNTAFVTVNTTGLATGVAVGSANVTATVGSTTGSATVQVTAATLISVAVNPSTASFAKGSTQQFTLTGTYSDGSTQNLTGSATWSSSANSVATISSTGLASGAGTGSVQFTGSYGGKTVTTGTDTVTAATLTSIAVTPTNPSFAKGTTTQLHVTGTYSDGTTQDLSGSSTYTSSNQGVVSVGSNGLASGVGTGSAQITITSGGKTVTTGTVTVTAATLTSIAVTPTNPSFAKGTTTQLHVTGTYSDGTTQDLSGSSSYTSSNQGVVTINGSGLASGVGTGSAQITITSGGQTVTTGTVTVGAATLNSITVTPTSAHAAAGTTVQLTATGTYSDGSTADVSSSATWTTSDQTLATVSTTGLVTGVGSGLASITAQVGSNTSSATVRVSSATLTSVAISPSGASFAAGTTKKFTLTGTFSDGSTQDLSNASTWTSSSTDVATVDSTGLVTGVAPGSVQFTASYNGQSATTPTVTVAPATLVSIAVTPSNASFAKGTTTQFHVTGTYSDGSMRDLTGSATYASSDPTVVGISGSGLAQGLTTGSVQLTIMAGGQTVTTPAVTVTPATLSSIAITPSTPSIAAGSTQQFTATGTFTDGSTQDLSGQVVWMSSNPQVLTIGSTGVASSFQVGTAQVSATLNGTTATTGTVHITPATLASLAVSPTTVQIAKGTVKQMTATGTYTDGTTQNLTTSVTWTTSDGTVVAVNANGLTTGTGLGSATVTASLQGQTASTTSFQVTAATLVSIAFNPANPTVATGSSAQVMVIGTFSDGSTQDLSSTAMYSSSNPAVATANAGVLSGVGPGSSTVTVQVNGVTSSFMAAVSNATLVSIAITPTNPAAIAKGTFEQFTTTGTYSDGTTQNLSSAVSWTSTNPAVFTINQSGLATGTGSGNAQLMASYQGQTAVTPTFQGTPAALSSLAVTPDNNSLVAGTGQQYTATATYSDGTTQDVSSTVSWSTNNQSVATVSSTGFVSASATGNAAVKAQLQGLAGTANLTVTAGAITPQQVVVASGNGSNQASVGAMVQYTATLVYSNQTTQDVTASSTWTSSNTSVATVNSTGLVTIVGSGSTTIRGQFASMIGSATVTVSSQAATLQTIAISPSPASSAKGLTQQFTAKGTYSDGTTQNLTSLVSWQTSSASIATINSNGLASCINNGQVSVQASYQGQTAQSTLTVSAATLQSLSVTPNSVSLANGTKQQFMATGLLSDGSTEDFTTSVTWSSSNTSLGTVNAAGDATGVGVGQVTITAQAGSVSSTATMTVTSATATSVQLTPASVTTPVGGVQQMQATAMFSDGTSQDVTNSVTYTSSNTSIVTVDANGKLKGVATGTASVTATLGSASVTARVDVSTSTLTSLAITPANVSLAAGLSQQLTATGTFADGSTQDLSSTVIWTSSNTQVAPVTSTGKLTASQTGTATITAKTDSLTATDSVTVTAAVVNAISVSPASTTLAAGQTQQFAATASFTDGSQQTVTSSVNWSVSDPTKATINNSGSQKGFLTSSAAGMLNVTATLNSSSGSAPVTVLAAALTSLHVTPNPVSVPAGTTQALTVTGTYTDGSTQNVTSSTTWTSGSASVATVNTSGVLHGITTGTTSVTATVGSTSATDNVTVTAAVLSSIAVTPSAPSVALGLHQQMVATGTYTDGTTMDITSQVQWSSSSASVATISGTGLVSTLHTGTSTLTATLNSISGTAALTVTPAVLQTIAVTSGSSSFALGLSLQLYATGTYSDGTTQNLTNSVTWTSSSASVGMVNSAGLATGVTTGGFTARAAMSSVTGTLPLTVTAAVLQSIVVTPANQVIVSVAGTTQFMATGHYSDGTTQNITNSVHWAVSGPVNVGTINQSGQLSGVNVGVAGTVTATSGTISGSTGFTVVGI